MPVWEEVWGEARSNLLAWFILAVASTLPVLGLWILSLRTRCPSIGPAPGHGGRPRRWSLFPPQRTRCAPWGGLEVCLVFFFALVLLPALLDQFLKSSGFFHAVYGPDSDPTPAAADRRILWVTAFGFPFQIAGIVLILGQLSGTRFYQLGLVRRDAARSVVLGWLAWFVLTPPVLILNVLVSWGYWIWKGAPPEEHPLARLAHEQLYGIEWVLIGLAGVILAPVLEELLFRRVLQGWAAGRPWGGPLTLLAALAFTVGKSLLDITEAWEKHTLSLRASLHTLEPVAFVLIVAAGCFLIDRMFRHWLRRPYTAPAIYVTALLFAVFHTWPTPIPLFLLGLALGYLAYRTQNLIASIVLHALFNGVACLVILTGNS
jgi:membrane protease YdiL (CAAX protease family)